jgi:hypothetical protein
MTLCAHHAVYPIGVPVCYACLLFQAKEDIVSRHEPQEEKEESARVRRLAAVRSLYNAYSPEYWYW